jgi:colanic acid/amylovoran biosynthesis glycosyltransferase
MKIAFIVDAFPCLSETFVLNQIVGLLDRGHDVDIYAICPGGQPVVHADVDKYHLQDRTSYRGYESERIPRSFGLRCVEALGFVVRNFHRNPMAFVRALNVFKFGRQAASLRVLYKVMPFLDRNIPDYDIVHCHFGPNGDLGALLKDIGAIRGEVVTTFHGYDISRRVKARGDHIYDYLFAHGDMFLAITERWKNELIRLGCSEQKIVMHKSGGVDTSQVLFSPRALGNDGKVRLLTVGRLVEKKGVEYGIRAVAKVVQRYPHVEYRIAGDGPLRSDLESLTNSLGVSDSVRFLGWRRQGEIADLMSWTDILIAPSVTSEDGDQEGAPAVLVEALAQGLPVLSTWHGGIPELVRDGESGFLVPERDVDALVEKLEYLIEHLEIWPEMGRAGRAYIERNYDINELNDRLVRLYHQLLQGELA